MDKKVSLWRKIQQIFSTICVIAQVGKENTGGASVTIGQRIREVRKKRDKTLKQIAEATGLSLTFLSDLERDRTQPSLKTIQRIADVLEVTATELISFVDDLGESASEDLPPGLREFKEDIRWADQLTDEWIKTLLRVDYRGRRPDTKREWQALFVTLQSIMEPE